MSTEKCGGRVNVLQQQIEEVEKQLSEESALVAGELKQTQVTVEAVTIP